MEAARFLTRRHKQSSRYLDNLKRCVLSQTEAFDYPRINGRAARRVEGVSVVDPEPVLCRQGKCLAVIGDVLVYRKGSHLTPTYAGTLAGWLGGQLPEPEGS